MARMFKDRKFKEYNFRGNSAPREELLPDLVQPLPDHPDVEPPDVEPPDVEPPDVNSDHEGASKTFTSSALSSPSESDSPGGEVTHLLRQASATPTRPTIRPIVFKKRRGVSITGGPHAPSSDVTTGRGRRSTRIKAPRAQFPKKGRVQELKDKGRDQDGDALEPTPLEHLPPFIKEIQILDEKEQAQASVEAEVAIEELANEINLAASFDFKDPLVSSSAQLAQPAQPAHPAHPTRPAEGLPSIASVVDSALDLTLSPPQELNSRGAGVKMETRIAEETWAPSPSSPSPSLSAPAVVSSTPLDSPRVDIEIASADEAQPIEDPESTLLDAEDPPLLLVDRLMPLPVHREPKTLIAPANRGAHPTKPASERSPVPSLPPSPLNAPEPQKGDVVGDDEIKLIQLLNSISGVASWKGLHPTHGEVVIKLAQPEVFSDNPMMWQFDAEIQLHALQQIEHSVIQRALDWGEDHRLQCWFAVMEWIEGPSLADVLKRGPLRTAQGRDLFLSLGEGMAICHRQGVIHRKIQPSHIILTKEGPRLISFQWAGQGEGVDLQRKQQGAYQALGHRPKFLAPEWLDNAQITSAADIYALGATLLSALAPQGQTWRDAPASLQIAIAGALFMDPESRSDANTFALDLRQGDEKYTYQSSSSDPPLSIKLYEVVSKIREDELGWHLIGRPPKGTQGAQEPPDLNPWGQLDEIVEAVERAKRFQPTNEFVGDRPLDRGTSPKEREAILAQRAEALKANQEQLELLQRQLNRREEEQKWKEEAIRATETQLIQREAGLQEEDQRLKALREALETREEEANRRLDEAKRLEEEAIERHQEAQRIEAEAQRLMAEARVLQQSLEAAEEAHIQSMALSEAQLVADMERRHAASAETERERIKAEALRLIETRDQAQETARLERARLEAEEEVKAMTETDERKALEEAYLQEQREAQQLREEQQQKNNGAFRQVIESKKPKIPPPKESEVSEVFIDDLCWRLRFCPPGSAWVGSSDGEGRIEERPRHRVMITKGFWFSEAPITQAMWSTLMDDNPSQHLGGDRPVEGVTWLEAALFCNALSDAQGLDPAYLIEEGRQPIVEWAPDATGYRLPTESEWEYAARAGQRGQRHQYSGGNELDEAGWYSKNASGESAPVGLKESNGWGLLDLSGNVWEWCHDEWLKDSYRKRGTGLIKDPVNYQPRMTPRVVRGGAWYDYASSCRLAHRPGLDVNGGYGVGLRPCLPSG